MAQSPLSHPRDIILVYYDTTTQRRKNTPSRGLKRYLLKRDANDDFIVRSIRLLISLKAIVTHKVRVHFFIDEYKVASMHSLIW